MPSQGTYFQVLLLIRGYVHGGRCRSWPGDGPARKGSPQFRSRFLPKPESECKHRALRFCFAKDDSTLAQAAEFFVSPLTVHLIQAATRWHDPAGNRDDFASLMASGAAADVIMLPEMFSTGFTMDSKTLAETMDGPTVLWMRERAESLGSVIAGSLIVDDGGFFNRLIWATPDGGVQYYDKRHLFRMAGEDQYFSPGEERVIVSYQGWRLCLSVCYDLRFPVWLRNRGDYDALVCVANWPAARAAAWQTLLGARAIENQAYCIGLNIVGRDGSGLTMPVAARFTRRMASPCCWRVIRPVRRKRHWMPLL